MTTPDRPEKKKTGIRDTSTIDVLASNTLTIEAFWEKYAGRPFELIQGMAVEKKGAGFLHSAICNRIATKLRIFVDEKGLGEVTSVGGAYALSIDEVRQPDVAFVNRGKLAKVMNQQSYIPFTPDISVEVVSMVDTAREMRARTRVYLETGGAQVWIVYPDAREVLEYLPDGTAKTYQGDQVIEGSPSLPGLNLSVNAIFPPQDEE